MCNASALREFKVYLTSANLLTVADTTDASYFTELYSPGCERDGVTLERLWFFCGCLPARQPRHHVGDSQRSLGNSG